VERVYRFIRDVAYDESVRLAEEKGVFSKFDTVSFGKASFVRKLPQSLRMDIKKHGIRNVTLLAGAPTGCLVGDSLISTDHGVFEMGEMEKRGRGILKVSSDENDLNVKAWYEYGKREVCGITTKMGYTISGTPNHKVRILSPGNGYAWKQLGDLEEGDLVVLRKNFLKEKGSYFSQDRSELLGWYMGDGWWTKSGRSHRLYFSCLEKDVAYLTDLIRKSFRGIEFRIIVRNQEGCKRIEVNSKKLYDWFEKYGCLKEGASGSFVPKIVLESGRGHITRFLKGLWLSDGHVRSTRKRSGFVTTSEKMAYQVQFLLLGLGMVSSRKMEKMAEDTPVSTIWERPIFQKNPAYRISMGYQSTVELLKVVFGNGIDVNPRLLKEKVILREEDMRKVDHSLVGDAGDQNHYITTYRALEIGLENWFTRNDLIFDTVKSKETGEVDEVFDLEVYEKEHTYVANGFVTHNTTSLIADCNSGIEALFSKAYRRKDNIGERYYIHPIYQEYLEGKMEKLPEWFVDAHDVLPSQHMEVLEAGLKFVDSNISKTINCPKGTTVEQVEELLLNGIWNLKGTTIYVDGSRDEQVLYPLDEKEARKVIKKKKEEVESIQDFQCLKGGSCEL